MSARCSLLWVVAALWWIPAVSAQARTDVDRPGKAAAASTTLPVGPAVARSPGGAPKLLLASMGTYVTQPGAGAGGADVSEIEQGLSTFGFSMQSSSGVRLADDFTVPSGETWDVTDYRWLTYQTGAPTTGTITMTRLALWTSDPLQGGMPSSIGPPNSLKSQVWTGVYRVTSSTLGDTSRAVIETTSGALWTPTLSGGTYWLDITAAGSLSSGPWGPVRVPRLSSDNGRQRLGGTWQAAVDIGSGLSQDFLFAMFGLASTTSLTTYCTAKPSSVPACVPTIVGIGEPDCMATRGFVLQCGPVPGNNIGLFFYTTGGAGTPLSLPLGWLCINPSSLYRVPLTASNPWSGTPGSGGTTGSCDGAYVLDFNRYFAFQVQDPSLVCGASVDGQFWYRDPPNLAGANFSNAAHFVMTASPPVPSVPAPTAVTPSQGGQGTLLTVSGSGFGSTPGDLKLLLANGIGFADVTSVAGTTLTATVFPVGSTGVGPLTLIQGSGTALPAQNVNLGGIVSDSSLVRMIAAGTGVNFSSFTLSPGSANTVSSSVGIPLSGGLTLDLTGITGDALAFRVAFEIGTGEFYTFQGRIDFTGMPVTSQRAQHLAEHLETSFGSVGLMASPTLSGARLSMVGATYGSVAVVGL